MRDAVRPSVLLLAAAAVVVATAACRHPSVSPPSSAGATPAASPAPPLPAADRVRIAEAFRLADRLGDSVWAGWHAVPFALLLVTPTHEYLVRHPRPSADFVRAGYDSLLGGEVLVRRRVFPPSLEATFPAVGGVSTVVIGDAERTHKTSTAWVLTALHEHFHQLQTTRAGYYDAVNALGLTGGDTTGMWMLNYPFPYDTPAVQERFAAFTRAAAAAAGEGDAAARLAALAAARDRLRAALAPNDYRYLAFQLWQEGVARYTEYELARLAAAPAGHYAPSAAFRALPDYQPFDEAARTLRERIVAGARAAKLASDKRVALYPAGAQVALLLDEAAPGWRARYFERMFSLDALIP